MTMDNYRDERAALRARIDRGLDALRDTILSDAIWADLPMPAGRLLASVLRQVEGVRHALR